jgi:TRAP-type C4-dicarboxylate transport system permease small subunit
MKLLAKADEILAKVLKGFVTALCVGIALILFLRVIIRFTPLHISLSWTDEVVEWMMAWMIFTASTLIFRSREHFRVELLQDKYRGKAWVDALGVLISLMGIAFFTALLVYSANLALTVDQFSPILKVSMRLPYSSIPVNCVLILLYLLRDTLADLKKVTRRRSLTSEGTKATSAG